jgi:hypothetical protein
MRALKTMLLVGAAASFLFAVQGGAQEMRDVECNLITASATTNEQQHVILHFHNGCRAPMRVQVCIPLNTGRWIRSGTPTPIPYNQVGDIDAGLASNLSQTKGPRWTAYSRVAREDPCPPGEG